MSSDGADRLLLLLEEAKVEPNVWRKVVGMRIGHCYYGNGVVLGLHQAPGKVDRIEVVFEAEPEHRRLLPTQYADVFTWMELPIALEDELKMRNAERRREHLEREREWERQRTAARELLEWRRQQEAVARAATERERQKNEAKRAEIQPLLAQYAIHDPKTPITDNLIEALQTVKRGGFLSDQLVKWANEQEYEGILADHFYNRYLALGDAWDLVKACSKWRKTGDRSRVIAETYRVIVESNHRAHNRRLLAALFTTRGGAQRDIGEPTLAENFAKMAIRHDASSYYPHNLLGGIYYDRGEFFLGDRHFAHAQQLGAPSHMTDIERRSAIERAAPDLQRALAHHLLELDPVRFAWAMRYL
jgi:hypothetical protein